MALQEKNKLITEISPPIESKLAQQLIDEFISLEQRYVLGDWEPATLDGGQFAEAASRIIYHQDSNNLNLRKSVNKCLEYVEDTNCRNTHHYPERKSALHCCKVIRSIYKFRSDRGAVHIDPVYTANQLDSKLVLENSRWVLSEILRVFWTGARSRVAKTIREIVQYDIPVIAEYGGELIVQRVDCTTEEEILILLRHSGELGLSRKDLGIFVRKDAAAITKALKKLSSNKIREVFILPNKNYRLTDLGVNRVLTKLPDKLGVK